MFKQAKGITLVSLVITIIVMLILAGVSLSMVMGENSVLDQATQAVDETERGTVKDEISIGVGAVQTKYFAQYSKTTGRKTMFEILTSNVHNADEGISMSDFANAQKVELFPKTDKSSVLLVYTHTNGNKYEAVITVNDTSLSVGETVCVERASGGTSGVGNKVDVSAGYENTVMISK